MNMKINMKKNQNQRGEKMADVIIVGFLFIISYQLATIIDKLNFIIKEKRGK